MSRCHSFLLALSFSVLSGVFSLSCAVEDERPPGVSSAGSSVPVPGGSKDSYPEGPYGEGNPVVGEVVEDLLFRGYVISAGDKTATDGAYESISMQDFRETGASYLFIHTSSGWCSTCHVGAYRLVDSVDAIRTGGGIVVELLVDGQGYGVEPTQEELEVWVDLAGLNMHTLAAGEDRVTEVFVDRDYVYIIDLETMTVVWTGHDPGISPAITEIGAEVMMNTWLAPTPP